MKETVKFSVFVLLYQRMKRPQLQLALVLFVLFFFINAQTKNIERIHLQRCRSGASLITKIIKVNRLIVLFKNRQGTKSAIVPTFLA